MIYRTLLEAQRGKQSYVSWIETVIVRVTLGNGLTYFRTYEFDQTRHKCKRCRKAYSGKQGRANSTGHVCDVCGNPYAGFVRQSRTNRYTGKWETMRHCWGSSGKLH